MSTPAPSPVQGTTFANPAPDAVDESWLPLRLLRDFVAVAALFALWLAVENRFGGVLSVVAAIPAGALIFTLFHEWGHFAGARLSGAHAPVTSLGTRFPAFRFDTANSTPRQFLAMSLAARRGLASSP